VLLSGLALGTTVMSWSAAVGVGTLVATVIVVRSSWRRSQAVYAARRDGSSNGQAAVFSQGHPSRRLLTYLHRAKVQFYLAATLSALKKVLDLVPPFAIGLVVTIFTRGPIAIISVLGFSTVTAQLWFVVGLSTALWSMESTTAFFAGVLWRDLAQTVQHELRMDAYSHVQRLGMPFFEEAKTGDLAAIVNDDINRLHLFLDTGADDLIQVMTNLVVIGPMFYVLAPSLAWAAVLAIPVMAWGSFLYHDVTGPRHTLVRAEAGRVNSQLVTSLGGVATVKSFTAEPYEVDRMRALSQHYRQINRETNVVVSTFTPGIAMATLMGFAGTMLVGGYQVIAGTVSTGAYASAMTLVLRFLKALTSIGHTVDDYQQSMAAFTRALSVFDLPTEPPGGERRLIPRDVKGSIVFDHVRFAYRDRADVFDDLSLDFGPGAMTALVGLTGSGKTTVIKLLLRFYEVQSGRILVDGIDIREVRTADLRRSIGLVNQDIFLFDGSARENIAYGNPGADLDAIRAAARLAEADGFIQHLPQGYDTLLGERGVKLSGGQRQRICLARAILKDPPILILDEATSSVDNETEAAIQRALEQVSKGRTTIVIAHRLSTVRHADRIYVLGNDGAVVEQGRHDQLVELGGVYSTLWRIQTGAAILEREPSSSAQTRPASRNRRSRREEGTP
jgi:ATP-binding cassette subfamily B protein